MVFERSMKVALLIILITACQSGPPKISIDGAAAEMSPAIRGEATVSMIIRNEGGPDVLTGVRTDMRGAHVSLHVRHGERMVETGRLDVPARSTVELKMDGSHIMIEDMPGTMSKGSHFTATLVFRKSGERQVPLTLQAASGMPAGQGHHGN